MKQLDIFGNLVDIETIIEEQNKQKKQTIKQKFREIYGFKNGYKCANCIYLYCRFHNNRNYYKCEKMMLTKQEKLQLKELLYRFEDEFCSQSNNKKCTKECPCHLYNEQSN